VRTWLLIGPALVAGLVALVVGWRDHEDNSAFAFRQHRSPVVQRKAVETVVRIAGEPRRTGPSGPRARTATCRPGSRTPLGNPWTCTARYPSGRQLVFHLSVFRDGSVIGAFDEGVIRGCCVATP
jgi:hypothetical protein